MPILKEGWSEWRQEVRGVGVPAAFALTLRADVGTPFVHSLLVFLSGQDLPGSFLETFPEDRMRSPCAHFPTA